MKTAWKMIRSASVLALVVACASGDSPSTDPVTRGAEPGAPEGAEGDGDGASSDGSDASSLIAGDATGTTTQSFTRGRRRPRPRPRPIDPCATVRCAAGTHCEADGRRATCVPDEDPCALTDCPPDRPVCSVVDGEAVCSAPEPPPDNVFCGGIAAFECPGAGTCIDDPSDDCDPNAGGADCGGICQCDAAPLILCAPGTFFDSNPAVCACTPEVPLDPCATVRCAAGTHCEVVDGGAICAPDEDPCALVDCSSERPVCVVVDGEAVCRAEAPFCGGIAGIECPGAGSCADDPNDGCDPARGGADCGGVCECNVLALCIEGFSFDASPAVCACVPVAP